MPSIAVAPIGLLFPDLAAELVWTRRLLERAERLNAAIARTSLADLEKEWQIRRGEQIVIRGKRRALRGARE